MNQSSNKCQCEKCNSDGPGCGVKTFPNDEVSQTVKLKEKMSWNHEVPEWDAQRVAVRKTTRHPGDIADPHDTDCPCFGDYTAEGERVFHDPKCSNCTCHLEEK